MSHHVIITKVWAVDKEEAEGIVAGEMEDSIQERLFDYFDHADPIEEKDLQSYGVKTFKEFDIKQFEDRRIQIRDRTAQIKDGLKTLLAPYFLTKDEAALCITTEDGEFKKCVEKTLKRKHDVKPPNTFDEMADVISKVVTAIAKKDTGSSMLMFYMEQIKKLQYCIDDPQPYNTLQCTENYYAEIPCDNKRGLKAFYFACDRHY